MPSSIRVRSIEPADRAAWEALWAGYNAFYGRKGSTALAPEITDATWERFFDPEEPVYALVAEEHGRLIGLTHYLFHRSTIHVEPVCYLQDLFTDDAQRGRGIGRALIIGVFEQAKARGIKRVYWQTHESNAPGRHLYDKVAKHAGFLVYSHER